MCCKTIGILVLKSDLVAWQGCYSGRFMIGNGTRQGGVLSSYLFTRYVRPLISKISQLFVNILAYADDMALLAPSWYAMQELLKILEYPSTIHPFIEKSVHKGP